MRMRNCLFVLLGVMALLEGRGMADSITYTGTNPMPLYWDDPNSDWEGNGSFQVAGAANTNYKIAVYKFYYVAYTYIDGLECPPNMKTITTNAAGNWSGYVTAVSTVSGDGRFYLRLLNMSDQQLAVADVYTDPQ
jgi:hypothetical protein